jgi:hypothetical protein
MIDLATLADFHTLTTTQFKQQQTTGEDFKTIWAE